MDKVYVLTIRDVSDGIVLTDSIEVYKDFNKAKENYDDAKSNYDDAGFHFNEDINPKNNFFSYYKYNSIENYIEIRLIECVVNL